MRPHPLDSLKFTCASCGHVILESAAIAQSQTRGEYLAKLDAESSKLGRGAFDRFGGRGLGNGPFGRFGR